ncbi:MAG TPA: PKD domain-containing protein, partial [Bacteroidales bacterium]|nr:PKD domain-containing protein [Bacteroidales bacterium]
QGPLTATAYVNGVDPATCTYVWNTTPAQNTQAINITTQGTYTVTVTSAGCTGTASTNIVFHNLVFHVDYIPEICAGTATSAVVVVTEGIPPYTYLWGPGGSNGSNININTTGNYSVTVTDNTGCTATESFDVTVHPGIILNTDVYDISCFGMQDGAIATNASGGTPPFTYEWTIPPVTDSIGGLAAGTYAVTVTDQNACTAFVDGIQISEPNPINFNIGTPASICSGDNTPLTVTVFGGTQPYTYHWDDLPTLNAANRIVSPTATTTYSVSITDAHGCTTTSKTVTITVSPEISLAIQTTNANCFNSCDGRAELNITGGVDPFLIDWESPNNPINTGLCAGDYSVTVTDNFGCKDSLTYQITQPDTLWSQTHSYSTNCFGSADGMAVVAAFGGVPIDTINSQLVYNYLWSNGDTNDTIIAASGTYYVTVTDDHGCTTRNQIFIDQPPAVYVTPIFSTWICIGQSVNYHAYATGGDGFYTFTWTGSDGTHYFGENITVNPVLTTSYTLQVLDNHQCVGNVQTVTVNVHPPLSILNVEVTPDSICPGEPVSVELDIVGGNGGPYSVYYSYTQIVNNPHVFSPAHSGYLAYLVTDMCGTPAVTDSVFVTVHPLPLNAFFADVPRACPPATVNFTEDSPDVGQSYLWDFGDGGFSVAKNPSHTYTLSGTYDVSLTVWSEWGCELTATNTNMIRIWPKPRAEFIATPEVMSILDPQVVFTNISDDANLFFWYFGDGETSLWT